MVRYKSIEYINYLEEELRKANEDKKELYEIAISDEEKAIREYQAKKTYFAIRNIRNLLNEVDYTQLEKMVNDIVDFHLEVLKKEDRYEPHRDKNNTEYKQFIRGKVYDMLYDTMEEKKKGVMYVTVGFKMLSELSLDMLHTTNRSIGKLKKRLLA